MNMSKKSYLPPRIKVRCCEAPGLMAGSGNGAGNADPDPGGDIDDGNSGGGGAIFGGGGAKINEREISFSNVWEE